MTIVPVVLIDADAGARRAAAESKLGAWDLFDLGKHWLELGLLTEAQFRSVFEPWEEGPHAFGRPRGFDGIDSTFQRRFEVSVAQVVERQTD